MSLGKYFTIEEMTRSDAAERLKIANTYTQAEYNNLKALVENILDPLRTKVGKPITINSGFRNEQVNRAVGGAATSQHRFGQAADLVIEGMTTREIVNLIVDMKLPYDQLIEEFGSWVHVSFSTRNRREVLQAKKVNGKTVYSPYKR